MKPLSWYKEHYPDNVNPKIQDGKVYLPLWVLKFYLDKSGLKSKKKRLMKKVLKRLILEELKNEMKNVLKRLILEEFKNEASTRGR
jgi:hypothetical protein